MSNVGIQTSRCDLTLNPPFRPYEADIPEWRKHITVTAVASDNSSQQDNQANERPIVNDLTVDLNESLCYSCQVNLKDYKDGAVENLPPFVVQKVYDQQTEHRLRSQIEEFLIDE